MTINPLPATRPFKALSIFVVLLITILLTTGCDNSSKSNNNFSIKQQIQKFSKETTLKGKVSYKSEPINSGEIKITDNNGKVIASTRLENDDRYTIKIPAGTELPITLAFSPEDKSKVKDTLISVVIYPSITKYDINELTTTIAKRAKALGGYTHTNMVLAADSTVGVPDANKTTTGFRGDPTKQYGGWH